MGLSHRIFKITAEFTKKWLTIPTTGDNRWEFQPIFYNPNINFKQFSRGKKFITPEDFRFTPVNDILSLRLTDIAMKVNYRPMSLNWRRHLVLKIGLNRLL